MGNGGRSGGKRAGGFLLSRRRLGTPLTAPHEGSASGTNLPTNLPRAARLALARVRASDADTRFASWYEAFRATSDDPHMRERREQLARGLDEAVRASRTAHAEVDRLEREAAQAGAQARAGATGVSPQEAVDQATRVHEAAQALDAAQASYVQARSAWQHAPGAEKAARGAQLTAAAIGVRTAHEAFLAAGRGEAPPATAPTAPTAPAGAPGTRGTEGQVRGGLRGGHNRWNALLGAERITQRTLAREDRLPHIPANAFVHEEVARRAAARGEAALADQHRAEAARLRAPYEAKRAELASRTDPLAASRLRAAETLARPKQQRMEQRARQRVNEYGEEGALRGRGNFRAPGWQRGTRHVLPRASES